MPFPFPGDLPDPGIKPKSSALKADYLPTELQGKSIVCFSLKHSKNLINISHYYYAFAQESPVEAWVRGDLLQGWRQ